MLQREEPAGKACGIQCIERRSYDIDTVGDGCKCSRWLCLKDSCHANTRHCCIRREGRREESDLKKSRQISSNVTQYVDLLLPCCSSYRLVCIREWLVSIHLTLNLQHQSEAFIRRALCCALLHGTL